MTVHKLCNETDLNIGDKKAFKIADEHILLYRLDDGFYATQAGCTHLFKSMEKGLLIDGDKIQCPLHRATFDVRTGEPTLWAHFPPGIQLLNKVRKEKPLKTYTLKIDNGEISVDLSVAA
ncbi:MAG: Rieske 2Fe-2S domain-containing protein [Pseudomonadales bacterium]|nr:Rieske 2Fe-2S domain-containing protein [Pseudomonadales bacterium]